MRVACEKSLKEDALGKTVAEQESVRGEFPGPLPTIVRGAIVDPSPATHDICTGWKAGETV